MTRGLFNRVFIKKNTMEREKIKELLQLVSVIINAVIVYLEQKENEKA